MVQAYSNREKIFFLIHYFDWMSNWLIANVYCNLDFAVVEDSVASRKIFWLYIQKKHCFLWMILIVWIDPMNTLFFHIYIYIYKYILRPLSGKHSRGRYETPYPSSYGLNSTITVLLGEWLCHLITYKAWYVTKQRNKGKRYIYRDR